MRLKSHLISLALQGTLLAAFFHKNPHAFPISEFVIERDAYALSYDGQHRQAKWVYEYLTEAKVETKLGREGRRFKEDPEIPAILRATAKDYEGSGYDRGHLCPAADASSSEEAIDETFYFSNVSPKLPQLNRGFWAKLEKRVREMTKRYKALHVYTGPLYLPKEGYVKYQVIGENDVAVPTHFFKVIFAEKKGGSFDRFAYILPNESIDKNIDLDRFLVSIEKVEKGAGFIFRGDGVSAR